MDAAPVEVTVEGRSTCSDAAKARAALEEALAAARGPRRGASPTGSAPKPEGEGPRWIVRVRLQRDVDVGRAEAVILDDAGNEVARRTVTERGRTCSALTRALGAWATLVLDQELSRARDEEEASSPPADAPAPYAGTGFQIPTAPPADRTAADANKRVIEIGASGFLRSGFVGASSAAGVEPAVAVQVSRTLFLRPALWFGWSTDRAPVGATSSSMYRVYGLRLDACRRVPGNYMDRRGIELDACGGADLARAVTPDGLAALRASLGPSAVIRGELGMGLALEVRGGVGLNIARSPIGEEERPPLLVALGEVGISTRWP